MLKRCFLLLIFIAFVVSVYGQHYTLIETGRPQSFAYNNARNITGKSWGITFNYFEFNGVDFAVLDSINAANQLNEDGLAKRKGADWDAIFHQEVNAELEKDNRLRARVRQTKGSGYQAEDLIHLEKSRWGENRYKAYLFRQLETGGEKPFYIVSTYRLNTRKERLKLLSSKVRPIYFSYPENGIR